MPDTPTWIDTTARVTECRFQFARLNTFTFGLQRGEKFPISFDYYAHGQLYSGQFESPAAIPQNQNIDLAYNPLNPAENTRHNASLPSTRNPILVIGILGSILLSLTWFALLRGCH